MKKILLSCYLLTTVILAADYSSMSLEKLRDERQNVTNEDKESYISAVKNKMEIEKNKLKDNLDKNISNSTDIE